MDKEKTRELLTRCDELGFDYQDRAKIINQIMGGKSYNEIQRSIDQLALMPGRTISRDQKETAGEPQEIRSFDQVSDEQIFNSFMNPSYL